jgi:predicted NBD/HSP70 family sugar kinase
LNPKQIFDLAQTGNPQARTLLHSTSSLLAEAVSNISVLLNTSLIVFGGSFGTSIPLFEAARRMVEMNQFARRRIAASTLGDEAQLLGALHLGLTHAEAKLLSV